MALELHVLTALIGGCTFEDLNDAELLEGILDNCASRASLTVLDTRMKRFSPHGVTGVMIISQSHIAIHTWPEEGRLFLDTATCSTPESVETVLSAILEALPGAFAESCHRFSESGFPAAERFIPAHPATSRTAT